MENNMQNNGEEKSAVSGIVGLLRGAIAFCASIVIAMSSGIVLAMKYGTGKGILAGAGILIALISVSIYLMNNAKKLTLADCILPLIIGAMSAFLFFPISMAGMSIFSVGTCMGASLLLTIMLFMYKSGRIKAGWLVIPFLTFLYELLPVELPTDIDNILCLSGSAVNLIMAKMFAINPDELIKKDSGDDFNKMDNEGVQDGTKYITAEQNGEEQG